MKTIAKLLSGAVLAGVLLAGSAPIVVAGPKTKADCQKKNMQWDEATKTCTKKY